MDPGTGADGSDVGQCSAWRPVDQPFLRRLGYRAAATLTALGLAWPVAGAQTLPPPTQETGPPVRFQDFVGATACRDCHQEQFRAWERSAHGRAGGPPGPETLLAAFDGNPIRFRDAIVTPITAGDGEYWFSVQRVGRPLTSFKVDGVVGGGHMAGGGTQGFVSRYPDGTVRFLPFDFVREEGVWFCNTENILGWWTTEADRAGGRLEEGWVPITPEMRLADCGDWPPIRTLGTTTQFQNCQECHGSQILVSFDSTAARYETLYTSLTINCESCHGPGRRHLQIMEEIEAGQAQPTRDIGLRSLVVLDKDESLELCFRCHSVKQPLEAGFLPGMELQRYYSLKAPLWMDEPLRPDGHIRTFAYQLNHLYSDCYLNGSMTCVDCHAPHGLGYQDIWDRPLEGRFDDGQCLDCHASKAEDISSHTHHPEGSPGSSCVGCHMPYRQHPTVGDAIRFSRADHTIPVPRLAAEEHLGTSSACGLCHVDRPESELERQVQEWYGELKPQHPVVEGIVQASTVGTEAEARGLLLRPEWDHPAAQAHALGLYIRRFLTPDMESLAPEVTDALEVFANREDLDLKALALGGLHLARGTDPEVLRFLGDRLTELEATGGVGAAGSDAAVRGRWVLLLRTAGDGLLARGDPRAAVTAYQKALEVLPGHPGALSDLGLAHSSMQDFETAVEFFDRAAEADPLQTQVLVNRGVALENLDRGEEAIESYRLAIARNPGEALAHFNLGNVHFVRGEYGQAVTAYRMAVQHSPRLVNGHLMLAQSFLLVGMPDSAAVSARNVLEFDPSNQPAQRMLADLIRDGR